MLVLYPQVTYRSDPENTTMLSYHQVGLLFPITNKATCAVKDSGTHRTVPKQLYINPLVRNICRGTCSPQTPLRNCTFTCVIVRDKGTCCRFQLSVFARFFLKERICICQALLSLNSPYTGSFPQIYMYSDRFLSKSLS